MVRPRPQGKNVAIVGMDCWYPGAESLVEFWENILAKRQQFRRIPDQRLPLSVYQDSDRSVPDKTYGTEAAVIDGFSFDWQDRRIPKKVVDATDIVHWLALEVALKALENSRLDVSRLQKMRTGVILGNTLTGEWTRTNAMRMRWPFFERVLRETAQARGLEGEAMDQFIVASGAAFKSVFPDITEDTLAGALSNTIAGRICNFLDLHGGGYTVDGACSSSLIAVITAARNVASGDLDVAFAGGIDISLDTFELIGFAKTGALTPDEMRVYDRRANGFIPGEGCGFVILKRLEDAERDGDRILAVVQGWGISSDGKGGLTAPTVDGQAMAIGDAYRMAGYGLDKVDFIEGHGTGTTVGDKVEISALVKALSGEEPKARIGMTSLKSIVGHTKAAAGIGALIKATIAVNQRIVPPMAGVEEPNPIFSDQARHFYPVIEGEQRRCTEPMRSGVSAMGFGGINTHVTLESYGPPDESLRPSVDVQRLLYSHDRREILVYSARTQAALLRKVQDACSMVRFLSRAELADCAHDCARRVRSSEAYRAVVVAGRPAEAHRGLEKLKEWLKQSIAKETCREDTEGTVFVALGHATRTPRIAFLFPGQGAQRVNMGRRLMGRYPWARSMGEQADKIYQELRGTSLLGHLLGTPGIVSEEAAQRINQTEVAQPAISLVNALWLDFLQRCGIQPHVVAGHSLGELSALYAAKSIDFDTLIALATHRGGLMAHKGGRAGAMIYLSASQIVAQDLLNGVSGYAAIANLNAPDQTVLSGDPEALGEILEKAKKRSIPAGFLPVSNAFHSRYMNDAAQSFGRILDSFSLGACQTPFVTGLDGSVFEGNPKEYLTKQIRDSVNFLSVLETLKSKVDLIVEVGPGGILAGLARRGGTHQAPSYSVEPKPEVDSDFKVALAAIYLRGGPVQWLELYKERFTRPLADPASRVVIESPTERPLVWPKVPVDARYSLPVSVASAAVQTVHEVSPNGYAQSAGAAPKEAILSAVQHSAPVVQSVQNAPLPPSVAPLSSQKTLRGHDLKSIEKDICKYIAEQTGFDISTLQSSQRLLDDLNLDSIKVTDLVGNISLKYGVAGEITPAAFANASVIELAQAIKESADAIETSFRDPEKMTSVAQQSNSSLPAEASGQTEVGSPGTIDQIGNRGQGLAIVTPLSSATRKSGASSLTASQPLVAEVSLSKNRPAWVRNFTERYEPSPVTFQSSWSWSGKTILLLGVDAEAPSLARYQELLTGMGARVRVALSKTAEKFIPDLQDCDLVIGLMPGVKSPSDREDLASVGMLSGLACSRWNRTGAYLFVQCDDGQFGHLGSSGRIHSVKAFAQSLGHEQAEAKVHILSLHRDWEEQYGWILSRLSEELGSGERVVVAGYDAQGVRFTPRLELLRDRDYTSREIVWSAGDVVLVTGGAKGITAACALAFAKEYRTTMVLLGSSAITKEELSDPSHPVAATLQGYKDAGLVAHYVCCDITDEPAVIAMVASVRETIGIPRGVIHGAGVNHPRPVSTVDAQQAMRELAPKVLGMKYLLGALREDEVKLIVGLTSVIGVVGMPGNAWYGFANEALDLLLRGYANLHPHVETQTCAYSVWSEIGMGARLGSDKNLENKGISSIDVESGVKNFMKVMRGRSIDQQVVTTSRLGSVSAGRTHVPEKYGYPFDFTEQLLHFQRGVEAIAKIKLTLDKHAYLRDHNYRGAYLFPTVLGLEAMAQLVQCIRDIRDRDSLVIQNIKLARPITVGSQGTDIEIYAEELEEQAEGGVIVIKAGIRTAATGYRYDHFSAEFVLQDLSPEVAEKIPEFGGDLGIRPLEKLYGSILFQGPLFQRIQSIHHLESDNETAGCLVFRSSSSEDSTASYLLGDPYVRDTLLQSAQLIIPQNQCLPIEIDRIELKNGIARSSEGTMCFTDVLKSDEQSYLATVIVFDDQRRILQKMTNYRLRFLEKKANFPRAMDLIPKAGILSEAAKADPLAPYRQIAGQLVIDAEPNGPQNQSVFVHRFIPDFKTFSNLSRSIYFSHIFNWMGWAREMSSIPVLDRIRALTESGKWGLVTNWASIEVLGECRNKNRIVEARMWCGKVSGAHNSSAVLTFDWVSKGDQGVEERIAIGRMGFTWVEIYGHGLVRPAPFPDYYKDFIGSMIAQTDAPDTFLPTEEPYRALEMGSPIYTAVVGPSGGVPIAQKIFETGLFDANLVGNLYFGNYSIWMGKTRDWAFQKIAPNLFKGIGEEGELTCVSSKIQHVREAMPFDDVVVAMSLRGIHKNGIDLVFEFQKCLPNEKFEKLAVGEHRVIWTRVNERGEKVASPLPQVIVEHILGLINQKDILVAG
jgi:enediyne polyketide synthase